MPEDHNDDNIIKDSSELEEPDTDDGDQAEAPETDEPEDE